MTRIENESQYNAAMARIEELLPLVTEETPEDDIMSVELVLLSNLVADYDDEHYPIKAPSLTNVLRLRMYEMNLTQKALAAIIGVSPARLSEILSGKREPTLDVARNISTKLSIDANIVLGVCSLIIYRIMRKPHHPRHMKPDPNFVPCEVRDNDEIFPNGFFKFNITRMLEDIESGHLVPIKAQINVEEWLRNHGEGVINEEHMPNVRLGSPVIQAEICNGRFNIIDGNHRMTKAHREGVPTIASYKLLGPQIASYLISEDRYKSFISYWNDKLKD